MGIFQRKNLPERIFQNLVLVSWKNTHFEMIFFWLLDMSSRRHILAKNYNMSSVVQSHCIVHTLSIFWKKKRKIKKERNFLLYSHQMPGLVIDVFINIMLSACYNKPVSLNYHFINKKIKIKTRGSERLNNLTEVTHLTKNGNCTWNQDSCLSIHLQGHLT